MESVGPADFMQVAGSYGFVLSSIIFILLLTFFTSVITKVVPLLKTPLPHVTWSPFPTTDLSLIEIVPGGVESVGAITFVQVLGS